VINGYSELMRDIFGENGVGARSAVGMGSLPGNIAVEIEAIFEVTG
jgi:enamine deaminase RidA (YjgF/YER057c/UK114 family)